MKIALFTNNPKLNILLLATYWSYVSLLLLFVYGFATNTDHSLSLWLFQTLPLLVLAPNLIKKHFRAHSCLCFVIMAYFIAYVVEAWSPQRELTDLLGLLFSSVIFYGAMMSSRGLQRLSPEEEI